jgi:hypothetical protein
LILPRAAKEAFLEDSIVDLLLAVQSKEKIMTIEDCRIFVDKGLKSLVTDAPTLLTTGCGERIVMKIIMHNLGTPLPKEGKLLKLIKNVRVSDKFSTPLVSIYNVAGSVRVVLRTPDYQDSDTLSKTNIESLATLLHYTTAVKPENIFVYKDKELGETVVFESVHIKLVDELTSSAALPSGAYPGEIIQMGSYKANLPAILATLHLLGRKQQYLRKRTPFKDENVHVVAPQELRKTFNAKTGLDDKSKSVPVMLLKACLAVIVSTGNRVFPGGWIVSNRSLNAVKSDTGLIFKLGYAERVPDNHKLNMVLNHTTAVDPKGLLHLKDQSGTEFKSWSFKEFRAGVVLTTPLLDPTKPDTFDTQRKAEPLKVKSSVAIEKFGSTKYYKTIDSLNRAHAILVQNKKKSKTSKPIHYQIARNEFLHNTARCPIFDGVGAEHTSSKTLPPPVRSYVSKQFRWAQDSTKRSVDDRDDGQQSESSSKKTRKGKSTATVPGEDVAMSDAVVSMRRQVKPAVGKGRQSQKLKIPTLEGKDTSSTGDLRPVCRACNGLEHTGECPPVDQGW